MKTDERQGYFVRRIDLPGPARICGKEAKGAVLSSTSEPPPGGE
ncbi:MAG TPA: hypothetical protein VHR45_13555 [Thermoanaerobaculia bacterium]|nr:hypothetical protein [Thermoanaerobaculia bacterium]